MDQISTKKMLTLEELLKVDDYKKAYHGVPRWDLYSNGIRVRLEALPIIVDEKGVFKDFPVTYWDDDEGEDGFITFYTVHLPSKEDDVHHLLPEEVELFKALFRFGESYKDYKIADWKLSIAKEDQQRKEKEATILAREEKELASIASDYQDLFLSMWEDDTFDSAFYRASCQGYETNFGDYQCVKKLLDQRKDEPLIPKEQLKSVIKEMTVLYNLLSYVAKVVKEETDLDDDIGNCLQEWDDFVGKYVE